MRFVDEARITAIAGRGGNGCLSFRREKFLEFGGPDGGDGGRGGHVYAEADPALNTLVDFRYEPLVRAGKGGHGQGKNRTGAAGRDVTIRLPVGTEIWDATGEFLIADLTTPGARVLLARGGRGGFGNTHFKSSTNRAPRRTTPGEEGETRELVLRLKLLADAGLVGLPNAGKSTLLSRVSAAKPKIADYPFTTLHPELGVVEAGGRSFVLADIPGLIAGAHAGRGLGDRFLAHIERCRLLVHVIDATSADVGRDLATLRAELAAHGAGLADKPALIALNKIDAVDDDTITAHKAVLARIAPGPVFAISAASGEGLSALTQAIADKLAGLARDEDAAAQLHPPLPASATEEAP